MRRQSRLSVSLARARRRRAGRLLNDCGKFLLVPRRPELRVPDSLVDLSSGLRRQNGRARAIFHRFRSTREDESNVVPPIGCGDLVSRAPRVARAAPPIGEIRHLEGALLRICRTVRRSTSPPPAFWPGLASKIGPTSPIFRATDRSRLSGGRRAPNASQIWCGRFRRRGSFRWLSQRARCLPQPHEQHRDPRGRHPSRLSPCSAHGPHAACCGA